MSDGNGRPGDFEAGQDALAQAILDALSALEEEDAPAGAVPAFLDDAAGAPAGESTALRQAEQGSGADGLLPKAFCPRAATVDTAAAETATGVEGYKVLSHMEAAVATAEWGEFAEVAEPAELAEPAEPAELAEPAEFGKTPLCAGRTTAAGPSAAAPVAPGGRTAVQQAEWAEPAKDLQAGPPPEFAETAEAAEAAELLFTEVSKAAVASLGERPAGHRPLWARAGRLLAREARLSPLPRRDKKSKS